MDAFRAGFDALPAQDRERLVLEFVRACEQLACRVDYRDTPFEVAADSGKAKVFFLWLEPVEWRLCYALSLAWLDSGELPGDWSLERQFAFCVKRLVTDFGFDWTHIRLDEDDGQLYAKVGPKPPCPQVALWSVMAMLLEMVPDYLHHLTAAIQFCEQDERLFALCRDLRECEARVQAAYGRTVGLTEAEKRDWRKRYQEVSN